VGSHNPTCFPGALRHTCTNMRFCRLRLVVLLLVLLCTIGCDQTTKHLARVGLSSHQSWISAGGVIQLVLAENPGAFLSLGHWFPEALRALIFILAVGALLFGLFWYLVRSGPAVDWLTFAGLALVCAGGFSNLIDRVARKGSVTDFMVLRFGPVHTGVFNAADVAIVTGISIFVAAYFINQRAVASLPGKA
jgi:signal peptidase II